MPDSALSVISTDASQRGCHTRSAPPQRGSIHNQTRASPGGAREKTKRATRADEAGTDSALDRCGCRHHFGSGGAIPNISDSNSSTRAWLLMSGDKSRKHTILTTAHKMIRRPRQIETSVRIVTLSPVNRPTSTTTFRPQTSESPQEDGGDNSSSGTIRTTRRSSSSSSAITITLTARPATTTTSSISSASSSLSFSSSSTTSTTQPPFSTSSSTSSPPTLPSSCSTSTSSSSSESTITQQSAANGDGSGGGGGALSAGAAAGATAGAVCGLLLLAGAAFLLWRWRRRRQGGVRGAEMVTAGYSQPPRGSSGVMTGGRAGATMFGDGNAGAGFQAGNGGMGSGSAEIGEEGGGGTVLLPGWHADHGEHGGAGPYADAGQQWQWPSPSPSWNMDLQSATGYVLLPAPVPVPVAGQGPGGYPSPAPPQPQPQPQPQRPTETYSVSPLSETFPVASSSDYRVSSLYYPDATEMATAASVVSTMPSPDLPEFMIPGGDRSRAANVCRVSQIGGRTARHTMLRASGIQPQVGDIERGRKREVKRGCV
ncbi:hypothetical protein N656DRAFT_781183 [Canariomyces notabilis]|uniref:Uncharacterized protein n=1 Tax=Canariomyces notabilis TaxID=2074819 RepID=A0AAN6TAH6_9PEZI|nr:hypothetical protein N656DRAFT_781183 [Canariomyces arenarius]